MRYFKKQCSSRGKQTSAKIRSHIMLDLSWLKPVCNCTKVLVTRNKWDSLAFIMLMSLYIQNIHLKTEKSVKNGQGQSRPLLSKYNLDLNSLHGQITVINFDKIIYPFVLFIPRVKNAVHVCDITDKCFVFRFRRSSRTWTHSLFHSTSSCETSTACPQYSVMLYVSGSNQ